MQVLFFYKLTSCVNNGRMLSIFCDIVCVVVVFLFPS